MIPKRSLTLIAVFCTLLFIAVPALAAKSYFAERYDVTLAVQPDGTLLVTETIDFHFEGGPFTYVFRHLAYTNLDEIDRLQASMDGQVLPLGDQPGQVEVEAGRPLKVTWHFAPLSDSIHTFTLSYRVRGALRQEDAADTLIWRLIPEDHGYLIDRSLVQIDYPAGILPLSDPIVDGALARYEPGEQGVVFTVLDIDEDQPIDVTLQFPPGSLVRQSPAWQAAQQQRDRQVAAALPYGIGAAILTAVLGLMGVFLRGLGFRRDAVVETFMPGHFSAPPALVSPALAARLAGGGTPFLGTLFSLAQRGILQIEEGPKKWGSRTFQVVRLPGTAQLQPHERVFLDALFRKARNERVALSEIATLASHRQFVQTLDQELTAAGWRDVERSTRRSRFMGFSGIGLFLGLAVFTAGIFLAGISLNNGTGTVVLGAILMGMGGALGVVGLVGMIASAAISMLSLDGLRQAAAWKSFAGYLREVTRGRAPVIAPDLFERYLPYAAAFSLGTPWAKTFQKLDDVPVPAWFHGLQPGLSDGSFVAVIAAVSSADSSAASAAGAASAASGGGASGAG